MPQDAEVGGYDGQSHSKFSVRNKVADHDVGSLYNRSGASRKSQRKCQRGTEWVLRGQLSRDSAKGIAGGGGEGISMPCKDEEP